MSHFSLENDVWLCYNNCTCGISSLVEHLLPKQDRRVRFPYPAPRTAAESASAAVFLRPKCKQPDAFASGCCILYRGALPVAAAIPCGKEPADERLVENETRAMRIVGGLFALLSFLLLFLLDRRGIGRDTVLLFGALGYSVCSVAAPALTYYLDRKA